MAQREKRKGEKARGRKEMALWILGSCSPSLPFSVLRLLLSRPKNFSISRHFFIDILCLIYYITIIDNGTTPPQDSRISLSFLLLFPCRDRFILT